MKKLDKLILKSYLGPMLLTFSIAMFVLVLNFLWRKVETLIGKGLDLSIILELFAYASATLVPMALPLAILLASIMTMGNFGENSELTAMKSAGISLWRVFRPLIVLSVIFSVLAFYFASFVIPTADLKVKQLASDIKDKKPALNIRPNEFYDQIDAYVVRVNAKNEKTNHMYGILIYNHSKDLGNVEVIKADSGYMYSAENNQTMIFDLYHGDVFSEDISGSNYHSRPLTRIHFEKQTLRFDVSDFALQKSSEDKYSDSYKVLDIKKLYSRIDSLQSTKQRFNTSYNNFLFRRLSLTTKVTSNSHKYDFYKDFDALAEIQKANINSQASEYMTALREEFNMNRLVKQNDDIYLTKHWIEFYRKFTLSLACIILFFIGAPLGAIIRKGGLGMPVVVSIIAFVIYYVIGTIGESAAKSGSLSPLVAMWLSSIIFFPIGLFLTLKATSDSKVLSGELWQRMFMKTKEKLIHKKHKIQNK